MRRLFRDIHLADPVLSFGITVLTGILSASNLQPIKSLSGPMYWLAILGVVFTVFGACMLLIEIIRRWAGESDHAANGNSFNRPLAKTELDHGKAVSFWSNRSESRLAEIAEDSANKTLWIITHQGGGLNVGNLLSMGKIRRLILLHPFGPEIRRLAKILPVDLNKTADDLMKEIENTTKIAMASGVEVRWFRGPINALILGNPESSKGWAQTEIYYPWSDAENRPHIRIKREDDENHFLLLKKWYEKTWEDSEKPRAKDAGEQFYPDREFTTDLVEANAQIEALTKKASTSEYNEYQGKLRLKELQDESNRVKQEYTDLKNRCIPEQSQLDITISGRKDHEGLIGGLTKEVADLKLRLEKDVDHYKEMWTGELEAKIKFQLEFGYARIQWCGFKIEPRNLRVAVQFMSTDDVPLAKAIKGVFEDQINDASPWKTLDIRGTDWFDNPTLDRIVMISSTPSLAKLLADTFTEHNLVGERIAAAPSIPGPAPQISPEIPPDVRVVIFPKGKNQ